MDAEVLFEYERTQEDELDLKIGDIIRNVKEVDDGWCEGELNGVRGMFPDNFVKLVPASAPPPVSSAPAPVPDTSVPLRTTDPSKRIRRARVTFSYLADNSDELSLQPGQVVDVLEEEEEGWWRGRVGNHEGVFPSNFVEEILEEEPPKPGPPKQEPPQHATPDLPPPVDSQTGERHPPPNGEVDGGHKQGFRGPKVMPAFDPSKARAGLKKSSVNVAPPLEKPPEHKKAAPPPAVQPVPAKPTEKPVEQAKVTYEYEADNEDELTIRVGDIVDIINKDVDQQEGWWEVSLRGKKGLIPDNFVELLPVQPPAPVQPASASPPQPKPPASQPKHMPAKPPPPAAKEPAPVTKQPPPPAAKAPKKAPAPTPQKTDSPGDEQSDFPIPKTTPLDVSAVKDRPKNKNRPPSRSNLLNHEPEPSSTPAAPPPAEEPSSTAEPSKNLSPWQAELMKKKKQPKLAPKPKPTTAKERPAAAERPTAAQKSELSPQLSRGHLGSKDQVSKPDPPPVARSRLNTGGSKPEPTPPAAAKPAPKPSAIKPVQQPKPVEPKAPPPQDTPAQSEPPSSSAPHAAAAAPPTVVPDNSWKEAYEKLQEEFEKFKEHVTRELQILTDDLDKERKHRAGMDIDIDRLKKAQRALK